jgi:hypothetical protein
LKKLFWFSLYQVSTLHAISSYKDHCTFSNTSGPYFGQILSTSGP